MKIYFDESGQTGCVIQKDDILSFREQPTFALGALIINDEKDEEKIVAKYKAFKRKYKIDGEIKGNALHTRKMNKELDYFVNHLLDKTHYQVIIYDKRFYISTLLLLSLIGFEYQYRMPVDFYRQADYLSKQNDDFFIRYLKYIEKPGVDEFKEYVLFLANYDYMGDVIDENAIKIIAQEIIVKKIEDKYYDDFMTYGWYNNSKITNLINLNALSELIYFIKCKCKVSNKNITYIHDIIKEYEDTFQDELRDHNIKINFQDSKTCDILQIVDNFVSLVRHAYDRMIDHVKKEEQCHQNSEWDMKLFSKLINKISVLNVKFTVPMCDWAASQSIHKIFSLDYPPKHRNNLSFNYYYLQELSNIEKSILDIKPVSLKETFDTLDR